ncbi:MAG TPA: hypothetical protein VGR50_05625 [Terriglobales bacterium]|nr:hypothetical protein [Terriglobales bacterium]
MVACFLLLLVLFPAAQNATQESPAATRSGAAESCARKITYIQRNGNAAKPDERPTVLTEDEINAYFAAGRVKLPAGVSHVHFTLAPAHIIADLQVDFDQLTSNRRSQNPLLGLFTGIHRVQVLAHGEGSGGIARAHIDSTSLDGEEIPRFVLELFVDRLLQPRYPQASLDPTFKMPARVDTATVGAHKLTLTQK